jgi:membrane protein required for beta-lactamase induction
MGGDLLLSQGYTSNRNYKTLCQTFIYSLLYNWKNLLLENIIVLYTTGVRQYWNLCAWRKAMQERKLHSKVLETFVV